MGIRWEAEPEKLTSAQLEALSESDRLSYWAHVSVHAADHAARYALYGALTFAGALIALAVIVAVLLWGTL